MIRVGSKRGNPLMRNSSATCKTDAAPVHDDFYLQEVIAITLDFQNALQRDKNGL